MVECIDRINDYSFVPPRIRKGDTIIEQSKETATVRLAQLQKKNTTREMENVE